MADQRRWFKLYTSALTDPDLDNLDLADFARWVKLGACVAEHGTAGCLRLVPPARGLCARLQIPDFEALVALFHRLPNITFEKPVSIVSSETPLTVTFRNWLKYQTDYSTPRVRKFRQMKRLEEKRRDEKRSRKEKIMRKPGDLPPQLAASAPTDGSQNGPVFRIPESIQTALARSPKLGAVTRIGSTTFWQAEIRANGSVDLPAEILKAEAWLTAHPEKHYKNLSGFLHNWLGRADRPEE